MRISAPNFWPTALRSLKLSVTQRCYSIARWACKKSLIRARVDLRACWLGRFVSVARLFSRLERGDTHPMFCSLAPFGSASHTQHLRRLVCPNFIAEVFSSACIRCVIASRNMCRSLRTLSSAEYHNTENAIQVSQMTCSSGTLHPTIL